MDIKGKHAFVTGAAAGIGQATAFALADAGASRLVLIDLDDNGLRETAHGIEARGAGVETQSTDVSDYAELEATYQRAEKGGAIDICFNNAGIMAGDPVWPETSAKRIAQVISVNLLGVMYGTKIATEAMRGRGGVIINTSSPASFGPMPTDPFYSSTKAAVVNFTLACAHFAGAYGVRVNAILPGVTDTAILLKSGDGKEAADWLKPMLEVVNKLSTEEIAAAILELVRDDERAGECLYVQNAEDKKSGPTLVRLRDNGEFHDFAGNRNR